MLSVFRRIIHSKFGAIFAILFLGVIAAAFILGDVTSGQFGGASLSGGGTAAKAKGYKLTVAELQDRVQRVFENARRSSPELQIGEFFAQGGGAQVFDQLVQSLTLRAFADDQGMHISKRLIDAQIAQVPAFQDAAGNFSNDSFRALLARERLSEQALRDDIRREILQRQLLAPIGLGARPSENLVLPYASLLLEARQGNVAAIPAVAFLDDKDPTDAQLTDFYKKNSARFTIPEQRRIRYAVVDATRFAQAAAPSDADISAYYNQNKADYAASQTRSVEQLVLPTEAGAKAIAAQVKGGKSLPQAAQAAGLSVSTLEGQSRVQLTSATSKAVADAVFAAQQGELVGPVRGPLGFLLLRVTAVQDKPARPLTAVREEIVKTLRAQKEKQLLNDFTAKLEDQIADGGTFEEVAKDNGLTLETTPPLLATGKQVKDMAYVAPADIQPLVAPAFAMSADDDAQLVPITPDQRYALIAPGQIIAAAPPPLAEIKPLVQAQYKLNAGNQKAKALAEQVLDMLEHQQSQFRTLYDSEMRLWDKARHIARTIYGAEDIIADKKVRSQFAKLERDGYGHYPVCMAKTQYSFSTDPLLLGAPINHEVPIREIRLATGAEFLVVICGDIMTMPGLPRSPASEKISVNENKQIEGLF